MRKSSRGNPWHDERGRFTDDPRAFIIKNGLEEDAKEHFGKNLLKVPRKDLEKYLAMKGELSAYEQTKNGKKYFDNDAEYYRIRQAFRDGNITESEMKRLYGQEPPKSDYERFVSDLPRDPDAKTFEQQKTIFLNVASAAGRSVSAPIKDTRSKQVGGYVKWRAKRGDDGYYRYDAEEIGFSRVIRGESSGAITAYHEAFHYCSNHGVTEQVTSFGRKDVEVHNMEEVMAVTSSFALAEDTGVEYDGSAPYAQEIVTILPRLKKHSTAFNGCSSFHDFGAKAWNIRMSEGGTLWKSTCSEIKGKSAGKGYYKQYEGYLEKNRDALVGRMTDSYIKRFGGDKEQMRQIHADAFDGAFEKIKASKTPNTLSGNEKVVMNEALFHAMREEGIY